MSVSQPPHDATPIPQLPRRAAESNKGSHGRALIVGGARGMTGAAGLAGMAALRGGAGLVEVAVPRSSQAVVAGYESSYMTHGLSEDAEGRFIASVSDELTSLLEKASVLGCGPGLGLTTGTESLALSLYQQFPRAAVFDADALNALARHPDRLGRHSGQRVLTPHPGEFARLTGKSIAEVQADRENLARLFAEQHQVVLVLKGHHTCVTDGRRVALNNSGNPGMATGGTGDVLTGLLTALVAQGMEAYEAARLGVYLHGLAGDLAAAELGETSVIASDVVRHLPAAFVAFGKQQSSATVRGFR